MSKILRTSRAELDLAGIWTYIAQDSPDAADRLIDLKQRIQSQGIIYNSEWIQRCLGEIAESLVSPNSGTQSETASSPDSDSTEADTDV